MELIVLSAVGTATLLLTELCGLVLGHMSGSRRSGRYHDQKAAFQKGSAQMMPLAGALEALRESVVLNCASCGRRAWGDNAP